MLQKLLRGERGLRDNAFVLQGLCDAVSKMTNGYSGSDLKELCAAAMCNCVEEQQGGGVGDGVLNLSHFEAACR